MRQVTHQLGCFQQQIVLSVLSHTDGELSCVACHVATITTNAALWYGLAEIIITAQSVAGQHTNPKMVFLTCMESNSLPVFGSTVTTDVQFSVNIQV
jgi:hypothetical protein